MKFDASISIHIKVHISHISCVNATIGAFNNLQFALFTSRRPAAEASCEFLNDDFYKKKNMKMAGDLLTSIVSNVKSLGCETILNYLANLHIFHMHYKRS